ncbi:unnamed protein product [Ciceribacter sp. T2.26MG-112.2]|uniref:rRNA maturation RNase YbeY n=1 Tax=Ciceribacter sp. T2.26MG-112.2 TaxID=3137154 RepID=UPI000E18AC48|nr:rRNA maturation RNase YbeY [Ciceribacter naphthalenivorans]SSC70355.1 unnamed protein product [Ciceribacter naphthalenivorans]
MPKLDIQIAIEAEGWAQEAELESLAGKVLETAAEYLRSEEKQLFPAMPIEVSLVFSNDEQVRAVNAEWRGQDKPTNVLSFPAFPLVPGGKPGPMLGDIIIARETVEREAVDLEKSFTDHLTHLMVHGFLHLFGYDHMDGEEAEIMESLETRILASLGLSDPYAGQDPV